MKVILSVPDEGYSERTWWRLFWSYMMKVILIVPDEGYFDRTWWRLFWSYMMKVILSVPDEGYFDRTWWRFFQKRVVLTKFDIYVFQQMLPISTILTLDSGTVPTMWYFGVFHFTT